MPEILVKIGQYRLEDEYMDLLAAWPVKRINDGWTKR